MRVPDLRDWFKCEADEVPVWTVKSLSYQEISRANAKATSNDFLLSFVSKLSSGQGSQAAEDLKNALSIGDEDPADFIKRLYLLVYGSVSPECDEELAVKMATVKAVEFKELTDKILSLSGQGYEPEKSKPSGGSKKSRPS